MRVAARVGALARRFGEAAVYVALGRVAFLGFFAVAAQVQSAEAFGLFAASLALAQVLAIVASLGAGPAAQAVVPRLLAPRMRRHLGHYVTFCGTATIAGVAAVVMSLLLVSKLDPLGRAAHLAAGALWLVPALALSVLREFLARAAGKLRLALLPRDLVWTALAAAGLLLVPVFEENLLAAAALLLAAVEITASTLLLVMLGRPPLALAPLRRQLGWLRRSLALVANNTGGQLLDRFDVFVAGLILPFGDVALYAVANRLAPLAALSQRFILPVIARPVSLAIARKDAGAAWKELRMGIEMGVVSSSAVAIVLAVTGPAVLSLYGQEYLLAYPLLLILAVAQATTSIGSNFGLVVSAGPRPWLFALTIWAAVLPGIAVAIAVASFWGLVGLAFASLACLLAYNLSITLVGTAELSHLASGKRSRSKLKQQPHARHR